MRSLVANLVVAVVAIWGAIFGEISANDSADKPAATTKDGADHWAFQPLSESRLPNSAFPEWCRTPVDTHVAHELSQRNLEPATVADKRTLLRRLTFDLIGLPPTSEELDAYLQDDSPDAYARVVDRLLSSTRYGEQWGRHWLDVVRYADARDLIQLPVESDFREAWRYRDWVVSSFNRDLPYDQFLALQVAGDLLQPSDPNHLDADALVATGFLAIADFVPGDVDKTQMIADYVNDQLDVLGRSMLGLTLGCARCHDHKYDPISIDDYYAMAGIFFSTRLIPSPVKGNTPLVRVPLLSAPVLKEIEAQAAQDKQRLTQLPSEITTLTDRFYLSHLKQRLKSETRKYLLASWECAQARPDSMRMAISDSAATHRLEAKTLTKWVELLNELPLHPALTALAAATDSIAADLQAGKLVDDLSETLHHLEAPIPDPKASPFARSQIVRFRANDRRLTLDADQRITRWPNRATLGADAIVPAGGKGPLIASVEIANAHRPTVRFDGTSLLQAAREVPSTGSLFVVYRAAPGGEGSQRLIGWEDSAVGQHGIGLMPNASGGMHLVLRKNGASGDIVLAPLATPAFQLISLAWGPGGVVLFRDGERVGHNPAIESVSSDPAIPFLNLGGPGSGGSPRFRGDLCEIQIYSTPFDDLTRTEVEAELKRRWFADEKQEPERIENPTSDFLEELFSSRSPYWIAPTDRKESLGTELRQQLAALEAELAELKAKKPFDIPKAVVVQDGGPAETQHAGFQDAHVYLRGNPANLGRKVSRGIPRVLERGTPLEISQGSGRRELGNWLSHQAQHLTARVMVNRIWQHHFGEGLVRTSTNFGRRGDLPSHPALLDFLAREFIESGWSVKAIQRMIVMSSTYQQSTTGRPGSVEADPDNRWLSRMSRRRLTAEGLRDSLLSVSGQLDNQQQGPGFLDATIPRRSLYLMSVRTGAKASEFCPLFDGPDGGGVIERRNESIVAPQALYLMNDPFVDQLARGLAMRVEATIPKGTLGQKINRLYEIALGRPATSVELEIGQTRVQDSAAGEGWPRLCLIVLCTNEFLYVD